LVGTTNYNRFGPPKMPSGCDPVTPVAVYKG